MPGPAPNHPPATSVLAAGFRSVLGREGVPGGGGHQGSRRPVDGVPNPVRTTDAVPNDVPAQADAVPTANGVPAANGVQRCPNCYHELGVIAVVVPAKAAHFRTPEGSPPTPHRCNLRTPDCQIRRSRLVIFDERQQPVRPGFPVAGQPKAPLRRCHLGGYGAWHARLGRSNESSAIPGGVGPSRSPTHG